MIIHTNIHMGAMTAKKESAEIILSQFFLTKIIQRNPQNF